MRVLALTVAALTTALTTALLAGPPAVGDPPGAASPRSTSAGAQVARAPLPALRWAKCPDARFIPEDIRARARCATARVPLDYDRPNGATTKLALTKLTAARPARRIGSLFVNPGGPGGEAGGFALEAGRLLGRKVDARFDVIGIDPRGTGSSGRTTCRGRVRSPEQFFAFPAGRDQARQQVRADNSLRAACRSRATDLVAHASTADVARDMELIRRALREPQLSYYGISYGTYLGSTYAAMFPDRVRAMVVDGVLDPVAWSTGGDGRVTHPFSYRLGSGAGAYEALTAAWTECDRVGARRCALAPSSLAKWRAVLQAGREGRLSVGSEPLAYQDVVSIALGALYDGSGPRFLAGFVADLYAELAAPGVRTDGRVSVPAGSDYRRLVQMREDLERRGPFAAPSPSRPRAARPSTVDVLFAAVTCADGRNPTDPMAWERSARQADRAQPWFGRGWTWSSSLCARRGIGSGADSFRGPWAGTETSYPLLVVGNSHDPATPVRGALKVSELFDDSVFVLYDGWSHGALDGGACITATMGDYLADRTLPRDGKVCRQPGSIYPRP